MQQAALVHRTAQTLAVLSHRMLQVVAERDAARAAFAAASKQERVSGPLLPSLLCGQDDSSSCGGTSSEEGDTLMESHDSELLAMAAPPAGEDWMCWSTQTVASESERGPDPVPLDHRATHQHAVATYYMENYQPRLMSEGMLPSASAEMLEEISAKLSLDSLVRDTALAPKKKTKKRTTSLPPRSTSRSHSRKASPSPGSRISPKAKASVAATVATVARNARARSSLKNSATMSKPPVTTCAKPMTRGAGQPKDKSKAQPADQPRGRSLERRTEAGVPSAMRVIIKKSNAKPNGKLSEATRKPLGTKAVNTVSAGATAAAGKRSRSAPPKKVNQQKQKRAQAGH